MNTQVLWAITLKNNDFVFLGTVNGCGFPCAIFVTLEEARESLRAIGKLVNGDLYHIVPVIIKL